MLRIISIVFETNFIVTKLSNFQNKSKNIELYFHFKS